MFKWIILPDQNKQLDQRLTAEHKYDFWEFFDGWLFKPTIPDSDVYSVYYC